MVFASAFKDGRDGLPHNLADKLSEPKVLFLGLIAACMIFSLASVCYHHLIEIYLN